MKRTIRRRRFLAGAAAAVVLPSVGRAVGQESSEEIRTAFIGVGNRGGTLLETVLKQPNIRVAAVCDTDTFARDEARDAAQRDKPETVVDYRQALDLKDVDAVFIATPCYLHAPMAAAALDAGKYVYCEKPLGIQPEQVDLVLKAAARAKTFLQIGQQLRYSEVLRDVTRQIHEEKILGKVFVVKAQRHSTPQKPRERTREGRGQDRLRPAWYDDVKLSGDLIVENAVHNIDASNWLIGSRPVSAYGRGKKYLPETIPAGTIMMDGFSVEYIHENDTHVDYSQLYLHPGSLKELKNGQWYVIFGEKGAIELSHSSWTFHEMYGDAPPRVFEPAEDDLTLAAQKDFFACIRENRKPFGDVKVGATAALTTIMGREAIYKRRMVTWEELGVEV
jgi:predicted dehydrogenase